MQTPDLINERAKTSGNNYKLVNHTFRYDLRTLFSARIINIWNSLTNSVIEKFQQRNSSTVAAR